MTCISTTILKMDLNVEVLINSVKNQDIKLEIELIIVIHQHQGMIMIHFCVTS